MKTKSFLIIALLLIASHSVHADDAVINKDKNGLALKGFDAVAYFNQGKAIEGKKEFEHTWMDATWRFSTAENRDLFAKSPEKYAPQFGGYCAFGVTGGYLAPTDPTAWKVVEDKLYLNYDKDIQEKWSKDIPGNIKKANEKWPAASKTKPVE
ncbi:YHS domain protein [bacterium]|nr:YHS domain protein [bacterium]